MALCIPTLALSHRANKWRRPFQRQLKITGPKRSGSSIGQTTINVLTWYVHLTTWLSFLFFFVDQRRVLFKTFRPLILLLWTTLDETVQLRPGRITLEGKQTDDSSLSRLLSVWALGCRRRAQKVDQVQRGRKKVFQTPTWMKELGVINQPISCLAWERRTSLRTY